jgi:hypothetical protein
MFITSLLLSATPNKNAGYLLVGLTMNIIPTINNFLSIVLILGRKPGNILARGSPTIWDWVRRPQ